MITLQANPGMQSIRWAIVPYGIIPYDAIHMKRPPEVITDNIAQYSTVSAYLTNMVGLGNQTGIIRLYRRDIWIGKDTCGVQEPYRDFSSARSIFQIPKYEDCKSHTDFYLVQGDFEKYLKWGRIAT